MSTSMTDAPTSSSLTFIQRQIIAGVVGSLTTTLVLNPIGVLKVRTQAGQGGLLDVTKRVVHENGLRGFWMGSGLGLVQSIPSTVIYMTSYENIKCSLTKVVEDKGYHGGLLLGTIPGFSGAIARSMVVTILAPLELVRTRVLAGMGGANLSSTVQSTSAPPTNASPRPVWTLIASIYRTEGGIRAFYRGLGSTILRDTPFSAIYWMSFEVIKHNIFSRWLVRESTRAENATVNFLSGSTSGTLAAIVTHPFDVLKTQSQLAVGMRVSVEGAVRGAGGATPLPASSCARQVCRLMAECCCPCTSATATANSSAVGSTSSPRARTMRQGIAQIIRTRGFAGLFSGLSMRLATIIPGSGIMITVYEFAKTFEIKR